MRRKYDILAKNRNRVSRDCENFLQYFSKSCSAFKFAAHPAPALPLRTVQHCVTEKNTPDFYKQKLKR